MLKGLGRSPFAPKDAHVVGERGRGGRATASSSVRRDRKMGRRRNRSAPHADCPTATALGTAETRRPRRSTRPRSSTRRSSGIFTCAWSIGST